jgi:hypothetical protein
MYKIAIYTIVLSRYYVFQHIGDKPLLRGFELALFSYMNIYFIVCKIHIFILFIKLRCRRKHKLFVLFTFALHMIFIILLSPPSKIIILKHHKLFPYSGASYAVEFVLNSVISNEVDDIAPVVSQPVFDVIKTIIKENEGRKLRFVPLAAPVNEAGKQSEDGNEEISVNNNNNGKGEQDTVPPPAANSEELSLPSQPITVSSCRIANITVKSKPFLDIPYEKRSSVIGVLKDDSEEEEISVEMFHRNLEDVTDDKEEDDDIFGLMEIQVRAHTLEYFKAYKGDELVPELDKYFPCVPASPKGIKRSYLWTFESRIDGGELEWKIVDMEALSLPFDVSPVTPVD